MSRLLPLFFVFAFTTVSATEAPSAGKDTSPVALNALAITDRTLGTGNEARLGMKLKVHYSGWVYDAAAKDKRGKKFDSTIGRDPLAFSLGDPRLIAAWNQGIPGMRVGGKRELLIPATLGYGSKGTRDGVIPPDTALVFEIELLEASEP